MVRVLMVAGLLGLSPSSVVAGSVVPVSVYVSERVFVDATPVRVDATGIPVGVTAIVGWSAWIYHTFPVPTYSQLKVWHDGGTPHTLHSYLTGLAPALGADQGSHFSWTLPPVMLPLPFHKADSNDRFYATLECFPLPRFGTAGCEAFMTFYLLVEDAP